MRVRGVIGLLTGTNMMCPSMGDPRTSASKMAVVPEQQRLLEAEARTAHWRRWGPYLSERQWGTVYEWALGDVNPPVQAWAAWRVYKIDRRIRGVGDREFLEKIFHKHLLNFTWWVNRKDPSGKNVFQGGFLGLDNIGVFDRSAPLPTGGHIEQSDGTSWMGMYCLNMLAIALELAREDRAYQDVASKFFEHFVYIAHATRHVGGDTSSGTRRTASSTTSSRSPMAGTG